MDVSVNDPGRTARALLAEHRILRQLLDRTLEHAQAPTQGGRERLFEVLAELAHEMGDHIDMEERLLEPILREGDAWGDERVEKMREHHRAERTVLLRELHRLGSARELDAAGLTKDVTKVCAAVRRHLDLEEREYLNARVLRSDPVLPDAEDG
jgi:iron-sulfur cluster repair protein YtfE (RIC family)